MIVRFLKKESKTKKLMGALLFTAYLLVLLYFTVFSESLGRTGSGSELRYNLVLFTEIRRFWIYREQLGMWAFFLNIFGNIIAFIPCGFLLPSIFEDRRGLIENVFAGFMISFIIECTQLVFRVGSFDVDDMLLNTSGAAIGYLCWAAVYVYVNRKYQERKVMIREIELED